MATVSRDSAFMTAVRNWDGQCVLTKYLYVDWVGLGAAHLFPLAYGVNWKQNEFGYWITDSFFGSINSVSNGILYDPTSISYSTCICSLYTRMYGDTISFYCAVSSYWNKTTTKLPSSKRIRLDFQDKAWIRSFSPTPTAAPANFYDGTTRKQFWRIWEVTGRSSWNMTTLQVLIWLARL